MSDKVTVYEIITNRMIEMIETEGTLPWKRPWSCNVGVATNFCSKKAYRGVNIWLLGCQGYASPFWASKKQITDKGGTIKEGQKSSIAVFYKMIQTKPQKNKRTGKMEIKNLPLLRYYRVFNVLQCEGLTIPETKTYEVTELPDCETIGSAMEKPVTVHYDANSAYYVKGEDAIHMPDAKYFSNPHEFYGTKFHEMIHSTGHTERLNRPSLDQAGKFGDANYSFEELIAELGASFLSAHVGIEASTMANSAAYLKGWLKALQSDKTMIVKASAQSQKAVEYILGIKNDYAKKDDENE